MKVRKESKHELAQSLHPRYVRASRKLKGFLLDEFVSVTGYHRKYAQILLRHGPPRAGRSVRRPGRPVTYGPAVLAALQVAAEATGWICGKRLAPFLAELVPALEREGALCLPPQERAALLRMSAATIDRRLAQGRAQAKPQGLATTKPGSLLKSQVPVRTYTPWDDQRPGFVEIDLVAHGGESSTGSFLYTLDVVDVATGWTECAAITNKGQAAVFAALQAIRARLPFPLLGLDSDNGTEFLNDHLIRYCQQEHLTFTRCRAYAKNDQAHVEQKNYSVVRQWVGYARYESAQALTQMETCYRLLRWYVNYYLPVMKLIAKERQGARVKKCYDVPTTPYQRARGAGVLTPATQETFAQECHAAAPGPLALRRRLEAEVAQLWTLRVGSAFTNRATM
jgi:hypothetical protein